MDPRKANTPLRSVMIKVSTRSWILLLFQRHLLPRSHALMRVIQPALPLLACRHLRYTGADCPRTADFSGRLLLWFALLLQNRLLQNDTPFQERTITKNHRLLGQPTAVCSRDQDMGTK
ncbi:hypothetical protein MTO96_051665 [Rhipicephalus appendiculatus]